MWEIFFCSEVFDFINGKKIGYIILWKSKYMYVLNRWIILIVG